MQEENIRFCLLHEEGHKIKPQYGPACLFFFSLIILCPLALFLIFYREYPILVFSSLIYSLILVLITLATLHESFHDDEHDSDLFAAEILRDSYGIKKPSYTVYNTLTELYSIMYPKNSEDVTIFDKLQFGLVDIHLHPPIDKRVEKIARIVDCY